MSSNMMIIFLGFAMIALGILSFFDELVRVDPLTLFSFSLGALFLVIADFLDYLYQEKRQTAKRFLLETLIATKVFMFMFTGISIILLPFALFNVNEIILQKISDATVLIALGITLMFMGYKAINELRKVLETINMRSIRA